MSYTLPGKLTRIELERAMHVGNGINQDNVDAIFERGPRSIEEACIFAAAIDAEKQVPIEVSGATENGVGHNSRNLN